MEYPVKIMCRVLEVSTSGYYQWRKDTRSQREADDERLIDLIKVLHADSYGCYGVRRIVKGLKQQGILVNLKRIRRLMRQIGLKGKGVPRRFVNTTDLNHDNPVSENHLARMVVRCFAVETPDTKWVSDITYIWTDGPEDGWLYLAVVTDLFNRMVVGWPVRLSIQSVYAWRCNAPSQDEILHQAYCCTLTVVCNMPQKTAVSSDKSYSTEYVAAGELLG